MTDSFQIENYSILCSLNDRTIYIKVINTLTYMVYEINADIKEFRLPSSNLCDIYKIILKCLEEDNPDYKVNMSVNSEVMKINFSAKIGGFYNINFELLLREKLMSNDGQLTISFQQLEQRIEELSQEKDSLHSLINNLYNMSIPLFIGGSIHSYHKMNIEKLSLAAGHYSSNHSNVLFDNVECLNKLKELHMSSGAIADNILQKLKNKCVEKLTLVHNGDSQFTSIAGLTTNLPQLTYLEISSAPSLISQNIINELSKKSSKIKELKIISCTTINSQSAALQNFCSTNDIKLTIQ